MEDACAALGIEFRRLTNDMCFATHRLEADYRVLKCPSPVELGNRVAKLEGRLSKLLQRVEVLKRDRELVLGGLNGTLQLYPKGVLAGGGDAVQEAAHEADAVMTLLQVGIDNSIGKVH